MEHNAHYVARYKMRKDHRRSVALERSLDHLSRIHRAPINRTGEYLLKAKNAVSGIKEEAAEGFVFQSADLKYSVWYRSDCYNIAARELSFENRGCDLYYVF